ncbi:MAG TPA: hypothetical protein PKA10_19770 [Selenomonadales bacterium]|nr:hypothetical protein [Selenomonadales bacterium]
MGEYLMDEHTVALLHFNDGLKDESGKVWTAVGGASTSTVQSKFGGSSLSLDGKTQYLSTPNSTDFDFGSGDFTIDWWEYRKSADVQGLVFSRQPGTYAPIAVGANNIYNGRIDAYARTDTIYNGSSYDWDILNNFHMGLPIINEWTHYALVRASGYFYSFQNGKLILKSDLITKEVAEGTGTPLIGCYGGIIYSGYIDEFRISNIARWTDDFDPGEVPDTPTDPTDPTNEKSILVVNMDDGRHEYAMSKVEIDAFISWYNAKAGGIGSNYYIISKSFNLGPFASRKDYLVFDQIINFEVMAY